MLRKAISFKYIANHGLSVVLASDKQTLKLVTATLTLLHEDALGVIILVAVHLGLEYLVHVRMVLDVLLLVEYSQRVI